MEVACAILAVIHGEILQPAAAGCNGADIGICGCGKQRSPRRKVHTVAGIARIVRRWIDAKSQVEPAKNVPARRIRSALKYGCSDVIGTTVSNYDVDDRHSARRVQSGTG